MPTPMNAQMPEPTSGGGGKGRHRRDAGVDAPSRVEVIGNPQSPGARRVVELLRRNAVPFRWRNVDEDPGAHMVAESHRPRGGAWSFVVVIDGQPLVDPAETRVRDELGLPIESPAAAFRAFAAGASDSIVVGRGAGEDMIVTAHDSPDGAVCTAVHRRQVWIAVGGNRLLALHRLVTRVRAGDTGLGADRGHGPTAPDLNQLQADAGVFVASVVS